MKKRKKFECGHSGFGKYCHLCKQLSEGKLIQSEGKYIKPEE